jgi:hypothetical protein
VLVVRFKLPDLKDRPRLGDISWGTFDVKFKASY